MTIQVKRLFVLFVGLMFIIGIAPTMAQETGVVVENTHTVAVRSGPGTDFDEIGQLGWPAVRVPALAVNAERTWVQVNVNGTVGWTSRRYLNVVQGDLNSLTVAGQSPVPVGSSQGNSGSRDNECQPGGILEDRCPSQEYWTAGYYVHLLITGKITCAEFPSLHSWILPQLNLCMPAVLPTPIPQSLETGPLPSPQAPLPPIRVGIGINYMKAIHTTENQCYIVDCNDHDEIYMVVTGAVVRANGYSENIAFSRIAPNQGKDHYAFKDGKEWFDFYQLMGSYYDLGNGDMLMLGVVVREEDANWGWGTFRAMGELAASVASTAIGIVTAPTGIGAAGAGLGAVAIAASTADLVSNLSGDNDQTIGAYTVSVFNNGGSLEIIWHPGEFARMRHSATPDDGGSFAELNTDTVLFTLDRPGRGEYWVDSAVWLP